MSRRIALKLADRRLGALRSYEDARTLAKRVLPRGLYDYVEGGADDEVTLARNVAAFRELCFRPRMAVHNPSPVIRTTVLGTDVSMPVLTAPCGGMRMVHPEGDLGVARAAANAGVISIASSASGFTLEEIAADHGPKWFQLYRFSSQATMEALVHAAQAAGYRALVVTVDSAMSGNRERDFRNGFTYNMRVNASNALRLGPQLVVRPGWVYRFARDGMPFAIPNTARMTEDGTPLPITEMARPGESHSPSWDDIAWIRENWDGPMVVKGILTGEDAHRAVEAGADAVVVSNHGGRQLDGVPASIECLGEVVDAVGDSVEVLVDSGIRRGSDVLKALCLGARAVLVGRAAVWGLAAGGQPGVERMLSVLRDDLVRTMRLVGCRSVTELDRSWITASSTAAENA